MTGLVLTAAFLAASPLLTNVDEALVEFDHGNYIRAASLLDEFARVEPEQYRSNNLHYLRGRIAEEQRDWRRAEREFNLVGGGSVLYDLAVWHLARVALLDGRPGDAETALGWLPSGFSPDLMLELAAMAPEPIALEIYESLRTREARLERALIREDRAALWSLLRDNQSDDVAVRAARELYDLSASPDDRLFLANAYVAHRAFDLAEPVYASLLEDPDHAAEAYYGLGRTYFQLTLYDDALGLYRATILLFPDSRWAEEAESQMASTYWRKLDFEAAAAAHLYLIDKYRDDRGKHQSAVRDLVDIYRALGDTEAALDWIALGLANGPSTTDRAVLVFTRAKIEYLEGAYEAALASFRQLGGMTMRAVPNGTDPEEVRFFEALSLEKLGRLDEARAVWRRLAEEPFSYYGLKSSMKLGDPDIPGYEVGAIVARTLESAPSDLCRRFSGSVVDDLARSRRLSATRQLIPGDGETSRVGELVFLHLWDEAYFWASQEASRWDNQTLADLAFLAGDYRRAMLYADRLRPSRVNQLFGLPALNDPESEALLGMLYPAGFAEFVCRESEAAGSNPLWLRSIMWQESRYDPKARSGSVARGLMQFIPETALTVANRLGMADLDVTRSLYEPAINVRLGAHYWAELMEEFGEPEMALAAYNGGPHNVRRWRAKSSNDEVEVFVSDIGFVQTKDYVRRVWELYARYAYLQNSELQNEVRLR